MKRCPSCQSTFPEAQLFCTEDGTPLVSDETSSDLDKTLVAPPQSSSSADTAPTQVASTYPGDENQPQQPPSPSYAPQPQQQQISYAPPYQPQYAPQGYGVPKQNRKTLYIGIAAVVLLAGVGLLLWFLLSGGKSLGTYKGSLNDLLPEKVGAYSRASNGTLDDVIDKEMDQDAKRFFSYDEARAAKYENSGKRMLLVVSNFSSPDSAKAAFNKAKGELTKERGSEHGWTLKETGSSKKDGERAVYTFPADDRGHPEATIIVWTNGSVAFGVGPAVMFERGPDAEKNLSSVPTVSETIDFEKNMPH